MIKYSLVLLKTKEQISLSMIASAMKLLNGEIWIKYSKSILLCTPIV